MSRVCSIADCGRPAHTRGWCGMHYFRWRKHGDPMAGRTFNGAMAAFIESFAPPPTDECIDWPFAFNDNGYGVRIDGEYPHRLICARFHGPAPTPDHEAAHGCGRRPCINPGHLRWATHAENEGDKVVHGTRLRGEDIAGAVLTEEAVIAIRRADAGVTNADLARRYGVEPSIISVARRGLTWKHVSA